MTFVILLYLFNKAENLCNIVFNFKYRGLTYFEKNMSPTLVIYLY